MLARYWRIRSAAVQSTSTNFATAEVEMRGISGGADLTGSGTAISGSNFSGMPAANAFDNNTETAWASANGGATNGTGWIGYDFGSDVDIREISITARNDSSFGQAPIDFLVEASADNVTWTAVKRHTTSGWTTGSTQVFAVPAAVDMGAVRAYAAGVQVVSEPEDPPLRVYALGVQVVRDVAGPPPTGDGRRRQQQLVT